MTEKQTLHIRIRDLRRERSLTQEELAEALGVSRQSINAMEAGRCLPSLPIAMQLSSFFSVPLQVLFSLQEEQEQMLAVQQLPVLEREGASMSQLAPWSPLRDMREMLDGLMDENAAWSNPASVSVPAVNIFQNEQEVCVEMCLPGFKREDLSLEIGEDFLTVSGTKREENMNATHYFRREFTTQTFTRTVPLPAIVHTDNAKAEMKQGVLSVHLPKIIEEKPKSKRLEISSED